MTRNVVKTFVMGRGLDRYITIFLFKTAYFLTSLPTLAEKYTRFTFTVEEYTATSFIQFWIGGTSYQTTRCRNKEDHYLRHYEKESYLRT
jgi:hypothetical protein